MAWLPPEFAYQMSMATHICAGVTGVMVWDIVTSLGEDYQIFFKRKVGLTNVVYFISRIASMLFMVLTMILVTSPIGNCPSNQKIFLSFFSIAIASSNLLFFFRLRAIYTGHKAVIIFGFILWVISAGGTGNVYMFPYLEFCPSSMTPSYSWRYPINLPRTPTTKVRSGLAYVRRYLENISQPSPDLCCWTANSITC